MPDAADNRKTALCLRTPRNPYTLRQKKPSTELLNINFQFRSLHSVSVLKGQLTCWQNERHIKSAQRQHKGNETVKRRGSESDWINYHKKKKDIKFREHCWVLIFLSSINYELSCEASSLLLCVFRLLPSPNRFSISIINFFPRGKKHKRARSCKIDIQHVINRNVIWLVRGGR